MTRRGGTAVVTSAPGEGTKVSLKMPRSAADAVPVREPVMSGVPRVVLVDDHGLFRSGVRAELGRQVEVVGEADDVQPAIELIGSLLPDVVLLDVHLPGGGGQAVVQAIKAVASGGALPGAVRLGRARGRDRGDQGGRAGLRDQDDLHRRAGRRDPPGRGGRRGVLAPAGRVRAGRVRRSAPSAGRRQAVVRPRA